MTIATSSTAELPISKIVRHAYVMAGLWGIEQDTSGDQWSRRASYGMELLDMVTKGLEAEGRLVRARRFYNLTLVADQADYVLPAEILDVYGDAMFIQPGDDPNNASYETVIRQIDQDTWNRLGTRQSESRPTVYFAMRNTGQVTLRFWQKPDAANAGYVRVQAYYLLANATDGNATMDLERHWTQYLVTALAASLAEGAGFPVDKVGRLMGEAKSLLQRAKAYSRQRTNNQAMVMHRVGRGGYRNR